MTNCNKQQPKIVPDLTKVLVSREEFLKLVSLTLSGVIGLVTMIPGMAFLLSYFFLPKRNEWVTIGSVETFKEGKTVDVVFQDPNCLPWDGIGGRRSTWLRRLSDESFTAFAINCTHLGCPVRWEAGAELFMCPCHGGVYYSDGEVAAGPPPRPLHQYPVRINNGQVEIQVIPVLEG